MTLEFDEIYLGSVYKVIATCIIYIAIIIAAIIVKSQIKNGSINKYLFFENKESAIEGIKGFLKISLLLGLFLIVPFVYVYFPGIVLVITEKNAEPEVKIIYVCEMEGANGYSIFDDAGTRYYYLYEKDFRINDIVYEFIGEYCELEYYNKSRVIKSISTIENIDELGKRISTAEIEELGIPIYPENEPSKKPAVHWEWVGSSEKGSESGYWRQYMTGETLNPDTNYEQPGGPHWDYTDAAGQRYRLFPDGRVYRMNDFN